MKHDIIKTDNYLLVVDESSIKNGDWVYFECPPYGEEIKQVTTIINNAFESKEGFGYGLEYCKKVIAHLPLNDSPILEGVDLLPSLEEDVEKLADRYANQFMDGRDAYYGYKEGYNKAKEKYKYTEEDLRKAWNAAYIDAMSIDEETYKPLFFEDFIQSLSEPKMPIGFECETDYYGGETKWVKEITTTPEGHTQWVGTYIFN